MVKSTSQDLDQCVIKNMGKLEVDLNVVFWEIFKMEFKIIKTLIWSCVFPPIFGCTRSRGLFAINLIYEHALTERPLPLLLNLSSKDRPLPLLHLLNDPKLFHQKPPPFSLIEWPLISPKDPLFHLLNDPIFQEFVTQRLPYFSKFPNFFWRSNTMSSSGLLVKPKPDFFTTELKGKLLLQSRFLTDWWTLNIW